ncbi:MAG: response regulator [Alphaproteobacteria bacterium]|nr:response regulator [Alphaproteobacteria bacterium]
MANIDWRRLEILIVEDNRYITALITTILRSVGARDIRNTVNGAGALSLLQERRVDIVLADYLMESMDGIEFTKAVRRNPDSVDPFLPIVMVTGFNDAGVIRRAIDAGVNTIVIKPVAPKTLLTHVARTLLMPRPFVRTKSFFGPTRRRPAPAPFRGPDRRKKPQED